MKYYYFVSYLFHTQDLKEGTGSAEVALEHKIERYCDIIDIQNTLKNQLNANNEIQVEGICVNNFIFLRIEENE